MRLNVPGHHKLTTLYAFEFERRRTKHSNSVKNRTDRRYQIPGTQNLIELRHSNSSDTSYGSAISWWET